MLGHTQFLDLLKSHLLIQLQGYGKVCMCFQIQALVPCRFCALLNELYQIFSVAFPFDGIHQIELLEFCTIVQSFKFRKPRTANNLAVLTKRDKVPALIGLLAVKVLRWSSSGSKYTVPGRSRWNFFKL